VHLVGLHHVCLSQRSIWNIDALLVCHLLFGSWKLLMVNFYCRNHDKSGDKIEILRRWTLLLTLLAQFFCKLFGKISSKRRALMVRQPMSIPTTTKKTSFDCSRSVETSKTIRPTKQRDNSEYFSVQSCCCENIKFGQKRVILFHYYTVQY